MVETAKTAQRLSVPFELEFEEPFEDELELEFEELFEELFELELELEFEELFEDEFELEFDELFDEEFRARCSISPPVVTTAVSGAAMRACAPSMPTVINAAPASVVAVIIFFMSLSCCERPSHGRSAGQRNQGATIPGSWVVLQFSLFRVAAAGHRPEARHDQTA